MEKKRKIVAALAIAMMVVLFGVASYAFFTTNVDNTKRAEAQLMTGTMALTFADNDNGINTKLMFGESVTKKFTIENTGTLETSLSLDWYDLVNTYNLGSLTYRLEWSEEENGTYETLIDKTNVPVSEEAFTLPISSEISVPAGAKYHYNLIITLENLADVDQSDDLNATFQTKFTVNQPSKYRYYTLVVDPNGGTWNTYTGAQTYLLMNNDTMNIPDPERTGYTFTGWSITSVAGDLTNNVYSMGISNAKLEAEWTINTYTLTIDSQGGTYNGDTTVEVEYNGTTEIQNPTREGYTFTGWEVSGGKLSGTTFTQTEATDSKLTATWQVNNYKYIVYHYQQSVDGSEYTLVSADTDEGEAAYNTTITPDRKTYTGFTSPSGYSLTIKAETTYPPVLNKVDYEYARNKYTLTTNLNGGTYTGDTIPSDGIYYQSSINLGEPTPPTGYTFSNWTATSGIMDGNIYEMSSAANDTVEANYAPNEYAVEFNANGGTVGTQSKTVTYDSTYGELPTPEYPSKTGVEFIGWYTEASGGTQITNTTKVEITDNQTLYAYWTIPTFNIVQAVNAIQNGTTPDGVNAGIPNFGKIPTTEGVYAMEDDYGTSYYYRGAVENNYIKFGKWADDTPDVYYGYNEDINAVMEFTTIEECESSEEYNYNCTLNSRAGKDMYWRIIRINGDGTVRIMYDGSVPYENTEVNADRLSHSNAVYNKIYADAKYVGYMYGGAEGVASTAKTSEDCEGIENCVAAQANETSSNAKIVLEEWYEKHLNTSYGQYVADNLFCTDRTTAEEANTWAENDTTLGYGKNITMYGPYYRYVKRNPNFKCSQKNDSFTAYDEQNGNKSLNYSVGLITFDEFLAAGGSSSANRYLYLCKGLSQFTMSPVMFSGALASGVVSIRYNGSQGGPFVNAPYGLAPVISLTTDYVTQLIGDGTIDDVYRLPES